MPQKNHGKNIDPAAGLTVSHQARDSAGFVGSLQSMAFTPEELPLPPEQWENDWKPLLKTDDVPSLFCIAIDGSLPPGAQSIHLPEITHHAARRFSFFPVCARAVPWPALFEKKLMEKGLWTPTASHAMAHCSAGFIAALPGQNIGHGAHMAPIPAYFSATQAALERPWSEWGFEKLNLQDFPGADFSECPAETLAKLIGIHEQSDKNEKNIHLILSCPSCKSPPKKTEYYPLRTGSAACKAESMQITGGQFSWYFHCDHCHKSYPIMQSIQNHIQHTANQRSMAFMEIMEVLLYVEMVSRILKHLDYPNSEFHHVIKHQTALDHPLLLVKDGPLVVSPTSRMAPYLKAWATDHMDHDSNKIMMVGIEKNSTLLSELARGYSLGTLQPSHYCILKKPGQLAWNDDGISDPKDKSKWAQKIALILPHGATILSIPSFSKTKSQQPHFDAAMALEKIISHISKTLSNEAHPSSEGVAHFSILAHLQKHTALPAREQAMGEFAYKHIKAGHAHLLKMAAPTWKPSASTSASEPPSSDATPAPISEPANPITTPDPFIVRAKPSL